MIENIKVRFARKPYDLAEVLASRYGETSCGGKKSDERRNKVIDARLRSAVD